MFILGNSRPLAGSNGHCDIAFSFLWRRGAHNVFFFIISVIIFIIILIY